MPTSKQRYVPRSLRLTIEENDIINAAAKALHTERSSLFQEAVIESAHRLGFYATGDSPMRKRPGSWKDEPQRHEESATFRVTISYPPNTSDLIDRVTDWLDVSGPLFIIGSTLRYISDLKKTGKAELQNLKLPSKYS